MPRLRDSSRARLAGALLLVALAFLAAFAYRLRQSEADRAAEPLNVAPAAPIEVERFSARLERTNDEERLQVGLRMRTTGERTIDGFVFVVARSDRATPKIWAIWPPSNPGLAISAGGHFHAAHPASGHPLTLAGDWERIDAVIERTPGQPPFDQVVIYLVGDGGTVLLARPFAL